jgi:hypothetical protein
MKLRTVRCSSFSCNFVLIKCTYSPELLVLKTFILMFFPRNMKDRVS